MLLHRGSDCGSRTAARALGLTFLWVLSLTLEGPLWAQDLSQSAADFQLADLQTVAESSAYRVTATGADTELFLQRLARHWSSARLESLGETVEGRPIRALVVEPQVKSDEPTLTVLLLGGIHAGECDGKEALLALARDYASGKHGAAYERLRLIFVPNFNADGNERVGVLHRPGQAGPELGMGVRENAQGLDLNRDFVKLETPEVQSLVRALARWDVDVLIDTHTTNGSLHRYDLTYDLPHNPALPASIDTWLRQQLLPAVSQKMESAGWSTFYYGNFENQHQLWRTYGHEPRYSTELMGLRGKIGVLVESYSYATYQRRVKATYDFVRELLEQLSHQASDVRQLIMQAQQQIVAGKRVPLRAELSVTQPEVVVKGYQQTQGKLPQPPFHADSAKEYQPHDYRIPLWASAEATHDTELPAAYAIPPSCAWALSRLLAQGVRIERLTRELEPVACEALIIEQVEAGAQLQNHKLRRLSVRTKESPSALVQGTYIVRTAQPLGMLAAYLLEPASDDGLAAWNFFDPDLRAGATYPIVRVMQPLPANSPADKLTSEVTAVEPGEVLSLDHIMRPGHTVEYVTSSTSNATWIEGQPDLVVQRDQNWWLVDPRSGAMRPSETMQKMAACLGKLEAFKGKDGPPRISPSLFSASGKFALLSHRNDLYLYDVQADIARQLTHTPKAAEQLAQLSPTGGHVVFVRDNDLVVVDCSSTEERRLTQNGSSELLNGILDWVYQEEIYGRGQFRAFWFSPDGQRVAFLQLDQSPVLHYRVSDSIHYRQELEDTRYPKAGDPLPIARMWIADLTRDHLQEVDLDHFAEKDRLIVRVTWSPTNQLWLQIQNRIQNQQTLVRVESDTGQPVTVLEEKSPAWIEVLSQPKFLPDGDFLWLSDLPDGRRHLSRFRQQPGELVRLTSGAWDITELTAVSPDGRTAYVTGNQTHPTELHLFSVDTQTGEPRMITRHPGTHRVSLSPDARYYIDAESSLAQPSKTWLRSIDGEVNRVLAAPISDRHRYVVLAEPKLTTIMARDGLPLQAMILLPNNYQAQAAGGRLPVLFHVYGGPQAPTVSNAWQSSSNYWWHQLLCSQGFAVVLCDNRAARGRGISDTWKIYRDMGRVELSDLEDAAKWVAQQPWADPNRLGLWGWSYGGYFTAYALTHCDKFKAGIAGAPVTDWHNYDAIYTERYMDLPQHNPEGYKSSSTVTAAANLHGRLLLIHGERDDNVHLSNTLQLAHALQQAGKPFEMMIYPKNRHGVVEPAQRFHLYRTMTDFLERNLKD